MLQRTKRQVELFEMHRFTVEDRGRKSEVNLLTRITWIETGPRHTMFVV